MKKKILILFFLMFTFFLPKVNALTCTYGHVVKFNANGGSDAPEPLCVIFILPTDKPARSGYKFLGWSTSKTASTPTYTAGESVSFTEDTTLYAVWSKGYKITYDPMGGTVSKTTKKVYPGFNYGELETPKKKGYTFLGWYDKSSLGTSVNSYDTVTKKKEHTLYAYWSKNKYTITYELNGGTQNEDNRTSYTVKTATFDLLKPTKKGYVFKGWYKESDFKNKVTEIKKGTTGNKTYYAKWRLVKYNIKFYGNGNTSGSTDKQSGLKYSKTYELNKNGFKKKYYNFVEWNTKEDKSGKVYADSEIITNLTTKDGKTIKLYAIWTKKKYKITYELNDGIQNEDNKTTYTVKTATFDLLKPTKLGYKFKGWYKESTFKNKVTEIKKGSSGNKTFYAKWSENTYKIAYVLNGGINPVSAPTSYKISDNISLPTPTRAGYRFAGWYKENTYQTKVNGVCIGVCENLTLYAKWDNLSTYTITYNLNGGTNPSGAPTSYSTEDVVTLPTPTKAGYTFGGWYTESTFKNKVTSIAKGSTGNKTFYAKWTITNYAITYNLNGGSNPSGTATTYTIDNAVTLPTPTRAGYTFGGWYTNSSFTGNAVTTIAKGSTGNKTFYAKWTVITYSITYNLNGGTNPSSAAKTYTTAAAVTLPTPTKSGSRFAGWYTNSSFTGSAVTTIAKGSTGNKTFYAKWTTDQYIITYNLNGGTNPSSAPTSYSGSADVTLPTPTKTGYSFSGWYTNSSFTGSAVTKIAKGSTGDKTFYAKWTIINYYITYELDGGVNSSNAVFGYNVLSEITLSTPTKSGYQFLGWYENENFTGSAVTKIAKGSTGDKVFFAKWGKLTTYTITYNLNGGTNSYNAPTTYTSNEAVTLPTPTRNGYGFAGWYTNSSFSGSPITTIAKGTTGNIVLYAKWGTITNYTITYNLNGGTNPSGVPTTYTAYETVTLPTPSRSGYIFEGWYTSSSFSGSAVTTIAKGSTGNKTFYAKWSQNTLVRSYSYTFYNNSYDDKISSKNDIKNTLYNIMNEGKTSFTVYCNYSSVDTCFSDYSAVTQDPDIMKSISDYVNPLYNYKTMGATRYSTGQIDISITYSYTSSEKTTINNKIDQIISQNNMSSMTNANKIKAVHDYIVNNTVYNQAAANNPNNSSYSYAFKATGVLVNGSAVCQGYADTFALFMDRFKIPNLKISSDTHTWNMVYINNKWLHVDATWDDPISSTNLLLYDYYLKTTSELLKLDTSQHTFNQSNYLEG